MKKNLNYCTGEINKNFRIKVYGIDENGVKANKLVGVAGLLRMIGEELCNKFLKRAFSCILDACVCKLRRGLKVTFYAK